MPPLSRAILCEPRLPRTRTANLRQSSSPSPLRQAAQLATMLG